MENAFDISVIVPIYNVEEYLLECLDSLYNQTKDKLEVLMIDDGSTDSSGQIAEEYAKTHEGFFYHHKENGGLGHTRNFGVSIARGKYITFIDSDDIVDSDLYEKMFLKAEAGNSEITICNVLRFNSSKFWKSGLHSTIFNEVENNTHISKSPILINDTISCNKLVLRSFYLENNFAFPENILYEDIPVTIPMHIKAKNVSIVESSYYYWRAREGANKSITQNAQTLRNITDRIKILRMLDKFFIDNNVDDELQKAKQKKALEVDLLIFLNSLKTMEKETALQMLDMVNEYVDEAIDPSLFSELSLINQQKYVYAKMRDIDKLIEIRDYQNNGYFNAGVKVIDGKYIASLPDELFTIKQRDITNELKKSEPKRDITDFLMKDGKIDFTTYLYTHRLSIDSKEKQKITAFLENEITGALTPVAVTYIKSKEVTDNYGTMFDPVTNITSHYNYDAACYKVTVDLGNVEINDSNFGFNRILIKYENSNASGFFRLNTLRRFGNNNATVLGDKFGYVLYDPLKEVRIYLSNKNDFVKSAKMLNDNIVISVENRISSLCARDKEGVEVAFDTNDNLTFTCDTQKLDTNKLYRLWVGEKPLICRERATIIDDSSAKSIVFMANVNHCVRFNVQENMTVMKSMRRSGSVIRMELSHNNVGGKLNGAKYATLFVKDKISGEKTILAKTRIRVKKDRFNFGFTVNFASKLVNKDLYSGIRDIYVGFENDDDVIVTDFIYSEKFFKCDVKLQTAMFTCYRAVKGNIIFKSEKLWRPEENTAQKRKSLTAENYPRYRQEPINEKQIVFESMWGSKYSCNPQHLYEYIDKNYPEYECIWSFTEERTPIQGNGIRVRRGSQEYYHYLATAKYFVNNVNFETGYVKRDGQIEIQTMHGTPLKTLGLDVVEDFPTEQAQAEYIEKNKRWDYLIVQGDFMADKAYSCYRFEKDILKIGYPRTDELFNSSPEKIKELKQQLGLPLDKKIILYVPTWRVLNKFDMMLDLEKMKQELGDEYIILVRIHHLCSKGYTIPVDDEFIFNLNQYKTVEDLYLITDILMTDYSSVMFDFALLNKPMLFFTYDLDDYRDNLRGMYVDIEKEAPGPLLFNTDEVIDAVKNIDAIMDECAPKITAFKDKYLNYENGESCQTIVDTVLKPNSSDHNRAVAKRKYMTLRRKLGDIKRWLKM